MQIPLQSLSLLTSFIFGIFNVNDTQSRLKCYLVFNWISPQSRFFGFFLQQSNGYCECNGIDSASMKTLIDFLKSFSKETTNICFTVDGVWANWGSWGTCSVTCETGTWTRSRTCTNPAPQYSGADCPGSSGSTGSCTLPMCPSKKFR